jgi:hypothetical protein
MRTNTWRSVVLSVTVASGLAMTATPAAAEPKAPPTRPSAFHCLVKHADGTQVWVSAGTVIGNHVCIAGVWYTHGVAHSEYDDGYSAVAIDKVGRVTADRLAP